MYRKTVELRRKFKLNEVIQYPCDNLTVCHPENRTLQPGTYLFELYGGQGGLDGGKGGYTAGVLHVANTTRFSFYIGAEGNIVNNSILNKNETFSDFSYNGGGKCGCLYTTRSCGAGGGGTDIRVLGDDYTYRILVAGGGGGSVLVHEPDRYEKTDGGYGGGEIGGNGDK